MKQQKKRDAEKREKAEKKYTSAEVTEMMQSMEEIRNSKQHQDKISRLSCDTGNSAHCGCV